jgi:glycosyltransferase involved in cell wall biosynthesis
MTPVPLKLLLVCYHNPESNMIGALRVRKFAENLAVKGCSVRVLSRAGIAKYEPGVQCTEASGPRVHAAVSRFNPASRTATARQTRKPGRETRLWSRVRPKIAWVVRHVIAVPDLEVVSVRTMFRHSRDLGAWAPQVIVASGPPFSVFFVAQRIARQRGIPWVADYRDLWTLGSYYMLGPIRRRVDRALESRLLRTASLVTTVSQPLADDMHHAFGVRSEVVLNGYDPTDLAAFNPILGEHSGLPLRILYAGEIYKGRRDPGPLFMALASMSLGPDQVLVDFCGDNVHVVEDAAQRYGVEHLVTCRPRLPHAESLALQRGADVLLLLMWNNPGERGVYTGKVFEYLGVRRPILMLGFARGVAADLIRSRSAGVIANDPDEIALAVGEWLATKRATGSIPNLPENVSAGLTRQEQSERLRQMCQELVRSADKDESLWTRA